MPVKVEPLAHRAQVIKLPLSPPAQLLETLGRLLDDQESRRAGRLRFEHLRTRFVAAHAGLRKVLGAYLDTDPASIEFEFGPQGKPHVASGNGTDLRFNLSHSEDLALIAVARGSEIGIDIEQVRVDLDYCATARYCFSTNEIERLEVAAQSVKPDLFYFLWTCKEAYIKARGGGLSIPLDQFEIGEREGGKQWRAVVERAANGSGWFVCELSPGPGFAGAMAAETRSLEMDLWEWSWSDLAE